MGHHTDIYSDPEKFFPERFEEMDTQTANQKDPRKFIFGFGKRYVEPSVKHMLYFAYCLCCSVSEFALGGTSQMRLFGLQLRTS